MHQPHPSVEVQSFSPLGQTGPPPGVWQLEPVNPVPEQSQVQLGCMPDADPPFKQAVPPGPLIHFSAGDGPGEGPGAGPGDGLGEPSLHVPSD